MSHIPPVQVLWLVVYWFGLVPVTSLLALGVARGADLPNLAALSIALVAHVIGAVWATLLARRHVPSTVFVKGSTTIRVIAVAWVAIGLYLIVGPIVSVLLSVDLGNTGEALGFISSVGSVSMLAIIGPGYAEYREAKTAIGAAA